VVERYIQLKAAGMKSSLCNGTGFRGYFTLFKIDVRIIGDEYHDKNFGRSYCEEKGIALHFNTRSSFFEQQFVKKLLKRKYKNILRRLIRVDLIVHVCRTSNEQRTSNNEQNMEKKTFNHACHPYWRGRLWWPKSPNNIDFDGKSV
jgi:hypothetical protein